MKRRISLIVIFIALGAGLAVLWYLFGPVGPNEPSAMVPATIGLYAEMENPGAVIEGIADPRRRLEKLGRPEGESTGIYGRVFDVISRMLSGDTIWLRARVAVAIDTGEFTYLPDFAVIVTGPNRWWVNSHVAEAIKGIRGKYPVHSASSGGWSLNVVEVGEEVALYVGNKGRALVIAGSAGMYGEVVSAAAGAAPEGILSENADFIWARGAVAGKRDLFVFARTGGFGGPLPLDRISAIAGDSVTRLLLKAVTARRRRRVIAGSVKFGPEVIIESCSKDPEPVSGAGLFDVRPGEFKLGRYLYPGVFAVYSWRMNYPALKGILHDAEISSQAPADKWLAFLRDAIDAGFSRKDLAYVGPETALVLSRHDGGAPAALLFIEVKDLEKIKGPTAGFIRSLMKDIRGGTSREIADDKSVPSLHKEEKHRGVKITGIDSQAFSKGLLRGSNPACAFVKEFFVFSSRVSALKRVIDASIANEPLIGADVRYTAMMRQLPPRGHSFSYVDLEALCDVVDEVYSVGADPEGTPQPTNISRILASILDVVRAAEACGSVSERSGGVTRGYRVLTMTKP